MKRITTRKLGEMSRARDRAGKGRLLTEEDLKAAAMIPRAGLPLAVRDQEAMVRDLSGGDAEQSRYTDLVLALPAPLEPDDVSTILDGFWELGLDANPYDDHSLSWVAERIAATLGSGTLAIATPEECFSRTDAVGVVNAMCQVGAESSNDGDRPSQHYGYPWTVVADLAAAGAGIIRHVNDTDLAWKSLDHSKSLQVPADHGDRIPEPADIGTHLDHLHFRPFRKFTLQVIVCALAGVKMIPILFHDGSFADDGIEPGAALPSHRNKPWKVSENGWHPFYYKNTQTPGDGEKTFQKHYLNVRNGGLASNYMRECARRKTIALAEFGRATGRYLAMLAVALEEILHVDIAEVLPFLEIGNEADPIFYGADQDPDGTGAQEIARYFLTIAASVRLGWAATSSQPFPFKYRFPALLGWTNETPENWNWRVNWLVAAIGKEIPEELTRLQRFYLWGSTSSSISSSYRAWVATASAAGVAWPDPNVDAGILSFTVRYFVHEVDFHFWHHCSPRADSPAYAAEHRMGEDIDYLQRYLFSVSSLYPSLIWAMGGVAFMAEEATGEGSAFFRETNPTYQASMLVRRMLYPWAKGASRIFWHTFIPDIKDKTPRSDGFDSHFTANGIRNDLFASDESDSDISLPSTADAFMFTRYAWRRPSWFALRRAAWLVSRAASRRVVLDSDGGVLLRLDAASGKQFIDPAAPILAPVFGQTASGNEFGIAWIAWLDQKSSASHLKITLCSSSEEFQVLPLVPEVVLPSDDRVYTSRPDFRAADASYPDFEQVAWIPGAYTKVKVTSQPGAFIEIVILRAEPSENPSPICVLTHSDTGIDPIVAFAMGGGSLDHVDGERGSTLRDGPIDRTPREREGGSYDLTAMPKQH